MAWFRLIWWWKKRRPISPEEAVTLRNLMIVQMVGFFITVALTIAMTYASDNHRLIIYPLGFGVGWIAAIRYYVWRYVGE